jgi:hypothetical protein
VHAAEQLTADPATRPAAAAPASVGLPGRQLTPGSLLRLQQTIGNAAVGRLLRCAGPGCACGGTCAACREEQDERLLQRQADDDAQPEPKEGDPVELPSMTFEAEVEEATDFAQGPLLHGKTTANFGGSAQTVPDPPKASRAKGCPDCGDDSCIRAQGTLVSTYASNPSVEMPDPDALDLTDCQKKNARKFINGTLTQHEQQHVKAFTSNYDGTTKRPFDIKACSADDVKTKLEAMFDTEQAARKKKAKDASDALDAGGKNQFVWDMDAGCDKEKS